jgi:hypothetical protein
VEALATSFGLVFLAELGDKSMLLALFVGFGKRRHELASLEEGAGRHRANLDAYSLPMLDQIIGVVGLASKVAGIPP